MANALGVPVSPRPTQGYSQNVQASDPRALDGNGNPIVTDVGDANAQAIRIGGSWGRLIALLLLYIASGGPGTNQNVIEYLSAAGIEIDPTLATIDAEPTGLFNPPN